jgi:hypothetical protein
VTTLTDFCLDPQIPQHLGKKPMTFFSAISIDIKPSKTGSSTSRFTNIGESDVDTANPVRSYQTGEDTDI